MHVECVVVYKVSEARDLYVQVLSTQMDPCMSPTNFLQIAKPKPVPPNFLLYVLST